MDKQDELFVVVNKHDKIISYRTRFECHHNRELMEELGIKIPLKRKKKYLLETDQETEMTYLFTAKYNGPFSLNKEEIEKIEFVDTITLKSVIAELTPFAKAGFKELGLL